ncbi:hypothetical protein PR202_ga26693 [Eleusine coracana subsp. coracana]|uniref:Uncharacterized protein n=1 Tax=Eleusine coracana subsp. coracana TaxID=191504 RepID=A0AAV5DFP0_ELECO|nr:hypothetical protein PR202_ga26693 [Eleusine coracana subsp. coracana]
MAMQGRKRRVGFCLGFAPPPRGRCTVLVRSSTMLQDRKEKGNPSPAREKRSKLVVGWSGGEKTMTTEEQREASRHEGRDSHRRRHHSSSRSRRGDPSPRRRRDDRRHESDRGHHKSQDEEGVRVADRDQKRNKDVVGGDGALNDEVKSLSHVKDDPPARRDRSPRGTKRFSESRESRQSQSFFQSMASGYGGCWRNDFASTMSVEMLGKVVDAMTIRLAENLIDLGQLLQWQEKKGHTIAHRDLEIRAFVRPDDQSFRRGFADHRSDGHRPGYDSRGRFPGRGRMDRDRFHNPNGWRSNEYQATSDQGEKWKHDLYDQTNGSPTPKTEEEQIAKVEALLAL